MALGVWRILKIKGRSRRASRHIATYTCNDEGFESSFFAKTFIKNREETTDIHYNLLSNRRLALNIAMKLYKNFQCKDGFSVSEEEIPKITDGVKENFILDKGQVAMLTIFSFLNAMLKC